MLREFDGKCCNVTPHKTTHLLGLPLHSALLLLTPLIGLSFCNRDLVQLCVLLLRCLRLLDSPENVHVHVPRGDTGLRDVLEKYSLAVSVLGNVLEVSAEREKDFVV